MNSKKAIAMTSLISVSTIKAAHAKQIQWVDMPDLKDMQKAIHPEKGDLKKAEVIGRIPGKVLHALGQANANTLHWCFLIKTPIGLFFMNAPDKTSEVFQYYQKSVPQLFV